MRGARIILGSALFGLGFAAVLSAEDPTRAILPYGAAFLILPPAGDRTGEFRWSRGTVLWGVAFLAVLNLPTLLAEGPVRWTLIGLGVAGFVATILLRQPPPPQGSGVRARISRWRVAYLAPLVFLLLTIGIDAYAPPCEDFLDGPCENNWVSGAALVMLMLAVLAVPVALARGVLDGVRWLRRRAASPPRAGGLP